MTLCNIKLSQVNTVLDNVFPSRMNFMRYVEDGSYIYLKMLADLMLNKEDQVVTVGIDDTTKAVCHWLCDVKTDHSMVAGLKEALGTFATCYIDNISQQSTIHR